MTDEVVYGPTKPPASDWRWQEVLSMEPHLVMAELQELDVNLFAARSELREAVRELAMLEDVLHKGTQQALEGIRDGADQDLRDRLFKGGTKDERAQRQATHLGTFDWVKQSWAEIEVASIRKDNAQVAFDSLLDRQTNLGRFANMYAATASLLASIRPPEEELVEATLPSAPFETTLYFVAVGKPSLRVPCFGSEDVVTVQREAKGQGYQEVSAAVYELVSRSQATPLTGVGDAMETAGVEVPDISVQTGVEIGLILDDDEEWPLARLFFIGEGKDPYSVVCEGEVEMVAQRRIAAELGYTEVDKATYLAHRDVWLKELEAEAEAGATLVSTVLSPDDHDEGEYGALSVDAPDEVVIPASMALSPDEAEAAAAAVKRHRGEESDDDPPFQPDEDISL